MTPESTTTTESADSCSSDGEDEYLVDLDADGLDETVFMRRSRSVAESTVGVCADDVLLTSLEVPYESTGVVGFVDLNGDMSQEILIGYTTERGTGLGALTSTVRGLRMTTLEIERWVDPDVQIDSGPFTGATYQCRDWDGDGQSDLIHTTFRPADGEENVSVGLVGLEGLEAVQGGIDSFETTYEQAADAWSAPDLCAPDSPYDSEVNFGTNGWASIPLDPAVFAGEEDLVLTGVAFAGGRLALVGLEAPNSVVGDLQEPRALAWWSDDGLTWSSATVQGSDSEFLDVVARKGGGFVAVGRAGERAAAWSSEDGADWVLTTLPATPGSEQVAYSVVETEAALVAVGAEISFPDAPGPREDSDAAVWVLADGSEWERVRDDDALGQQGYQPNADGEVNSAMLDAALLPGVGVVAVGYRSEVDPLIDYPLQHPAMWVSSDGVDWHWYAAEVDARLSGVSEANGRLVAYGTTGLSGSPDSNPIVLVSDDGAEWLDVSGSSFDQPGLQAIDAIRSLPGGGWIALGTDQAEFEVRGAAAAWTSEDLFTWHRETHDIDIFGDIENPPVTTMRDGVATDEGRLIVIGIAGKSLTLTGGGSVCCLYEPRLWVYDPLYDEGS